MHKLKIGLVGAGDMGQYLGAISHETEGVELTAVVAARRERARAVAAGFGATAYADHREMLAATPLDAVIVATPSHTHHRIVLDAVTAGVDVFCEKPMAHTVPECDEMIVAASQAGVRLMVGHVLRVMPLFRKIREVLDQGHLGDPLMASLVRIEKPKLWGWYKNREKVRSILHEVGTHELDLLRALLGDAETIQAWAAPSSRGDIDYDDTIQVQIRFRSGALGSLTLSWGSPLEAAEGYILCEGGTLHYDWRRGNLLEYAGPEEELITTHVASTEENDGYRRELHSFFEWVRVAVPPLVTAEDGRAAVELAEAAYHSLQRGQAASLPFPGRLAM